MFVLGRILTDTENKIYDLKNEKQNIIIKNNDHLNKIQPFKRNPSFNKTKDKIPSLKESIHLKQFFSSTSSNFSDSKRTPLLSLDKVYEEGKVNRVTILKKEDNNHNNS